MVSIRDQDDELNSIIANAGKVFPWDKEVQLPVQRPSELEGDGKSEAEASLATGVSLQSLASFDQVKAPAEQMAWSVRTGDVHHKRLRLMDDVHHFMRIHITDSADEPAGVLTVTHA